MQQNRIILFALVTAGLFSCSALTKSEALKMNNTLVMINDSLYYKGKDYGKILVDAIQARDFSKLGPSRIGFEKYIDSSKQSVIDMKDVAGSEELRNFEIELLTFEKHMISTGFAPFEQLNAEATQEQVADLFDAIEKDSKSEEEKMRKFKAIQAEFARKNGFALEPNKINTSAAN